MLPPETTEGNNDNEEATETKPLLKIPPDMMRLPRQTDNNTQANQETNTRSLTYRIMSHCIRFQCSYFALVIAILTALVTLAILAFIQNGAMDQLETDVLGRDIGNIHTINHDITMTAGAYLAQLRNQTAENNEKNNNDNDNDNTAGQNRRLLQEQNNETYKWYVKPTNRLLFLEFQAKNPEKNILTPQALLAIRDIQTTILTTPDFEPMYLEKQIYTPINVFFTERWPREIIYFLLFWFGNPENKALYNTLFGCLEVYETNTPQCDYVCDQASTLEDAECPPRPSQPDTTQTNSTTTTTTNTNTQSLNPNSPTEQINDELQPFLNQVTTQNIGLSVTTDGNINIDTSQNTLDTPSQGSCDQPCFSAPCVNDKREECIYLRQNTSVTRIEEAIRIYVILQTQVTIHWNGKAPTAPTQDEIVEMTEFIKTLLTVSTERPKLDMFFDKDFISGQQTMQYSQLLLSFGTFRATLETVERDHPSNWTKTYIQPIIDQKNKQYGKDTLTTYPLYIPLITESIDNFFIDDILIALFTIAVIFVYLLLYTRSLFLTTCALTGILIATPIAYLIHTQILGIKVFTILNGLVIILVLAIGVDDTFIILDIYRQSAFQNDPAIHTTIEGRMRFVWKRAGLAMLTTSATTAVAFLLSCLSPFASTCSLGILAATTVLSAYAIVMSLFFLAIIIYHDRWEPTGATKEELRIYHQQQQQQQQAEDNKKKHSFQTPTCFARRQITPTKWINFQTQNNTKPPSSTTSSQAQSTYSAKLANVLQKQFTYLTTNPTAKAFNILTFTAILVAAVLITRDLQSDSNFLAVLQPDHPFQRAINIFTQEMPYPSAADGLRISIIWGYRDMDRTGVDPLRKPEYLGTPRFHDQGISTDPACAAAFTDARDLLLYAREPLFEDTIRRNVTGARIVKTEYYFNTTINTTEAVTTCRRCNGTHVVYAALHAESATLHPQFPAPEKQTRQVYNQFYTIATRLDAIIAPACGLKPFQFVVKDNNEMFIKMHNQKLYRTLLIPNLTTATAIASVALLLTTRSLLLTLYSTICIISVLFTVIATTTLIGWKLGIFESVMYVILTGFAVDYTVHFAGAFKEAKGKTLQKRIENAYAEIGPAIANGMLTTVLAVIPGYFCTLIFFSKFSFLLTITIVYAWLYSNLLLPALIATFGHRIVRPILDWFNR